MVSPVKQGRPAFMLRGAALAVPGRHCTGGVGGLRRAVVGCVLVTTGPAVVRVPNATAVAVVLLFGLCAIANGLLLQPVAALRLRQEASESAGMLISAALFIVLGATFDERPDAAVNAIFWLLGAFSLASGVLAIYLATKAAALRRRSAA
jgi:uncharacterized membrane protein HdeD (DUF308 family)